MLKKCLPCDDLMRTSRGLSLVAWPRVGGALGHVLVGRVSEGRPIFSPVAARHQTSAGSQPDRGGRWLLPRQVPTPWRPKVGLSVGNHGPPRALPTALHQCHGGSPSGSPNRWRCQVLPGRQQHTQFHLPWLGSQCLPGMRAVFHEPSRQRLGGGRVPPGRPLRAFPAHDFQAMPRRPKAWKDGAFHDLLPGV